MPDNGASPWAGPWLLNRDAPALIVLAGGLQWPIDEPGRLVRPDNGRLGRGYCGRGPRAGAAAWRRGAGIRHAPQRAASPAPGVGRDAPSCLGIPPAGPSLAIRPGPLATAPARV